MAIGTYTATDVTAISTEIVAMIAGYFPAILGIFGVLLTLVIVRKLIKSYTGR